MSQKIRANAYRYLPVVCIALLVQSYGEPSIWTSSPKRARRSCNWTSTTTRLVWPFLALVVGSMSCARSPKVEPVEEAIDREAAAVVAEYMERGGSLEMPFGEDGSTALMLAAESGDAVLVQRVLAAGASVGAQDRYGNTALHYAARAGRVRASEALISAGADIHAKGAVGMTPLSFAAFNGHAAVAKTLLQHGANPNDRAGLLKSPALLEAVKKGDAALVAVLLNAGAEIGSGDSMGRAPFLEAAGRGDSTIVKLFLAHGADVSQKGGFAELGQTALHKAAFGGYLEMIGLLIAAKADIEARDTFGQTPLITAAGAGQEAAVKALLDAGANQAAITNDRKNARMVAQKAGHSQIVKLLSTAR